METEMSIFDNKISSPVVFLLCFLVLLFFISQVRVEHVKGITEEVVYPLTVLLPLLVVISARENRNIKSWRTKIANRTCGFNWHVWLPGLTGLVLFLPLLFLPFVDLSGGHLFNADTWAAIERARRLSDELSLSAIFDSTGYRWIPVTVQALCYSVGRLSPLPYHIVQAVFFSASAMLLSGITTELAGSRIAGLTAGLVFILFPIHVITVQWLLGLDYILTGFFFLVAWKLWINTLTGNRPFKSSILTSLVLFTAVISHEIAFTLPGIFFLTFLMLYTGRENRKISVRRGMIVIIPVIIAWGLGLYIYMHGGVQLEDRGAAGFSVSGFAYSFFMKLPLVLINQTVVEGFEGFHSIPIAGMMIVGWFILNLIPVFNGIGSNRLYLLSCILMIPVVFFPVSNIVLDPSLMEMKHFYFPSIPLAALIGCLVSVSERNLKKLHIAILPTVIIILLAGRIVVAENLRRNADLYFTALHEYEKVTSIPKGSTICFLFSGNDTRGLSYLFDAILEDATPTGEERTVCKEVRNGRRIFFKDGEHVQSVLSSAQRNDFFFISDPESCTIEDVTETVRRFLRERTEFRKKMKFSILEPDTLLLTDFSEWRIDASGRMISGPPIKMDVSLLDKVEIVFSGKVTKTGSAPNDLLTVTWVPVYDDTSKKELDGAQIPCTSEAILTGCSSSFNEMGESCFTINPDENALFAFLPEASVYRLEIEFPESSTDGIDESIIFPNELKFISFYLPGNPASG